MADFKSTLGPRGRAASTFGRVASTLGPRGRKGARGPRGHQGPVGPTGPAGASAGLLKFSGAVLSTDSGITFLADSGIPLAPSTTALAYPLATAQSLKNITANLSSTVPPEATVIFDLLQNGVPVAGFTVTYIAGESGIKSALAGPVAFAIGDTFDLRVTISPVNLFEGDPLVSATIGLV